MSEVAITIKDVTVMGNLALVEGSSGIVIFTHGSGSSRFSERNNFVARELQKDGFATLLFDLLTEEEDQTYENRFDIPLLTERLVEVTRWVWKEPNTKQLAVGYFGASTGSASALIAAAELGGDIKAVVSRGGRPDLAVDYLPKVKSPTLLIVGGDDTEVIELNQQAYDRLTCEKKYEIVPGATHLFEEPGALEEVARLAGEWFAKYV
ncbi:MAG: hydrolase [Candidatus Magasanikbacteria bacterium RIFCSPHIGHO2_02_FULL_51_14]|uniref:Hydrolase n=1 Tax=Candidatus Magasanikbacteria bacterium RIFCSPHIGHO2_02_FULL_51_14 TaxID=1798683 RepID=A0A1F6MDW1_9BACT|nr:MAG: hydrolase [Candidatus Magasanikbacteria bacterium RIFCSPHIGHO2_02_FULL_51_14]